MADEDLDPILIQITVPLPTPMIYSAWVESRQLEGWLCDSAKVEAKVGGAYELTWTTPTAFTSRGTVRSMTPNVDLEFGWTAPADFAKWMNEPTPATHVYLRLQDSPEGIDITLEHVGWKSGEPWELARSWHFHLWAERLERLRAYLIKQAYG
ncbi:MAG: SRPBCC family protein [Thermoplasmata archaeon]